MSADDSAVRRAQRWRTEFYFSDPASYFARLGKELAGLARRADRLGLVPCARLDGTSDLGIAGQALDRGIVPDGLRLWDYSKSVDRALAQVGSPVWDVTYSYHGNVDDSLAVLRAGGRVAVVYPSLDCVPIRQWRFRTVDGNATDLRFTDPPRTVCALPLKGVSNARKKRALRRDPDGAFIVRA